MAYLALQRSVQFTEDKLRIQYLFLISQIHVSFRGVREWCESGSGGLKVQCNLKTSKYLIHKTYLQALMFAIFAPYMVDNFQTSYFHRILIWFNGEKPK
mgnify:CR=1 FL=1